MAQIQISDVTLVNDSLNKELIIQSLMKFKDSEEVEVEKLKKFNFVLDNKFVRKTMDCQDGYCIIGDDLKLIIIPKKEVLDKILENEIVIELSPGRIINDTKICTVIYFMVNFEGKSHRLDFNFFHDFKTLKFLEAYIISTSIGKAYFD